MNRLVIVGNGFDLSLGMKTGYKDFICWLLKKGMSECFSSGPAFRKGRKRIDGYYKNELFEIDLPTNKYAHPYLRKNINELCEFEMIKDCFNGDDKFFELNIISSFFNTIYYSLNDFGWVDIEGLYFKSLKEICKNNLDDIDDLNNSIEAISKYLEEYLSEIEQNQINISRAHISAFTKKITKEELYEEIQDDDLEVANLYFLNFNYTNFLYRVTKEINSFSRRSINIDRNPIHGQINTIANPIIFGFGDEVDEDYKFIENLNDNRFLSHIKSFKYLNTPNYNHLMRFIDSDSYQVYIYGHSCGLSDRIMLKEIFENDNCKSIKIFYHQREDRSDDFMEKTQEISRHFDNKGLMRRKIVSKDLCQPLQQNN